MRTARTTHGRSRDPIYNTWCALIYRCHNPKHKKYPDYGARGIYVCDRWRYSFENFLADMGERPSDDHTVERKGNDGPYSPDNCIWAVMEVQSNNRRNSRKIEHQGEALSAAQWSRQLGIPAYKIIRRLNKGLSAEEALSRP